MQLKEIQDFMDVLLNHHISTSDIPMYAMLVENRKILRLAKNNGKQHAEVELINWAIDNEINLRNVTLFSLMEPCPMCLFFSSINQIKMIVFGCYNVQSGACGGAINLLSLLSGSYKPVILGGVREVKCSTIFTKFFQQIR